MHGAAQAARSRQLVPALQALPVAVAAAQKWAEAADFHWHLAATDRDRYPAEHPTAFSVRSLCPERAVLGRCASRCSSVRGRAAGRAWGPPPAAPASPLMAQHSPHIHFRLLLKFAPLLGSDPHYIWTLIYTIYIMFTM